ncbi:MAG TPA: alpha/beta hydrolase [Noviherbaspirillum sp.]|uniref:alpha/beta hydrolase n=1 Tax=Noviherbaspirillum sp. TaxID=1926288 RepID=UPI002D3C0CB3|nr:alpha/beta hydrolase [Noviherbaspirillum sp.]HYD93778.1 alpha/beta hydrolase [Noviherbaspirillum sp.]
MPKPVFQGRILHKTRSLLVYVLTSLAVRIRRLSGRPLVPEWTPLFEIGTLFWRAQFNHALALKDIREGRAYFDSLYTIPDIPPEVEVRPAKAGEPRGDWFVPRVRKSGVTMLYFHGGGYTFYAAVTRHFIAMLAGKLGVAIFAPDYRLTPEHPHPAQIEDGLAAYQFLLAQGVDPRQLIICGDSAGGHLALMTLVQLRASGLPQPALAVGLSPWTDTGRRGESQFGNDRYDMVQGYMTLQFAAWLKGGGHIADAELSPINQDFHGLAPIYLQAGAKEILVDMIRDFAGTVESQGGRVRLDVWTHMTHEFHAYGDDLPESRQAIERIQAAISWATKEGRPDFPASSQTEVDCLARRESSALYDSRVPA